MIPMGDMDRRGARSRQQNRESVTTEDGGQRRLSPSFFLLPPSFFLPLLRLSLSLPELRFTVSTLRRDRSRLFEDR